MNTTTDAPALYRFRPKNTTKPVNFYCDAPTAPSVVLFGDFNNRDDPPHPMQRQLDGGWFLQVQLTHGHHLYRFLVEGKPVLDPRGMGFARNEQNERVSLIAVS